MRQAFSLDAWRAIERHGENMVVANTGLTIPNCATCPPGTGFRAEKQTDDGAKLRIKCAGCNDTVVESDEWALTPASEATHAQELFPRTEDLDKWCWVGYIRRPGDVWQMITMARTLTDLWESLLAAWYTGDVLSILVEPQIGADLPSTPEDATPMTATRQRPRENRVVCEVEREQVFNGKRFVEGVRATCVRCGQDAEAFGTKTGSVRRALAMLRENCPEKEENYYTGSLQSES